MKVGGNESATVFFKKNGGTAALQSKDPKVKYTSAAAGKYKDELARRVEQDMKRNPNEVVVEDAPEDAGSGTNTPAGEPADDFFSSWDKPSIKRPSNPPSRTGTPSSLNRTASPFLNANGNGTARSKSPLHQSDSNDSAAPKAVAASAVRKTAISSKPKANILGAKKTKLGAKKVDASALDFDEAEKKAREEAERKERLGYDPDEETPSETKINAAQPASATATIHQPTPVSPARAGSFGAGAKPRERSDSEMERLGMGVRKLGFGQVGGPKQPSAAPKAMGFGSVSRAAPVEGEILHSNAITASQRNANTTPTDDSERFAREKFGLQKGISSDEFFGRGTFDSNAQSEALTRLQGFEGASSISSNAYFGRPEDEMADNGEYGDLETAAKDFVRKFGITAGDDIENLTSMLGDGASKLQGAIRNYLNG